jgi:phage FluMu protein Com
MTEIRCVKCNKRLFDLERNGYVSGLKIKCPKCGYIDTIEIRVKNEVFDMRLESGNYLLTKDLEQCTFDLIERSIKSMENQNNIAEQVIMKHRLRANAAE